MSAPYVVRRSFASGSIGLAEIGGGPPVSRYVSGFSENPTVSGLVYRPAGAITVSNETWKTDERLILFLWEMLASAEDRGLFAELQKNPDDKEFRGVCVDYLTDKGRHASAEMVRTGWTPGV